MQSIREIILGVQELHVEVQWKHILLEISKIMERTLKFSMIWNMTIKGLYRFILGENDNLVS